MTLPMSRYAQPSLSADDSICNQLLVQGQGDRTAMTQRSQPTVSTASAPTNVERVDAGHTSRHPTAESFAERQIVHFAMVLGRKWACTEPGHEMCFTGQGKHVPLTDDMIMEWVTALCKGEATTFLPPFTLPDESGSDSDTQQQQQQRSYQFSQVGGGSVLTTSMSASPSSMAHLEMASISNKPVVSPTASSSSLSPIATQPSRLPKAIKNHPSSSRASAISSASHVSRMSSVSTSSWHSTATGMTSLGSTAATSTSHAEDIATYASPSQSGRTVKFSDFNSTDFKQYSPTLLSNAASLSQRPPSSPRLSLPHSLPPPVSALPSPPGPHMSNPSQSTRPDSPVHSIHSEFSEKLSISLQQLQRQQQEPRHHPHRQQSLVHSSSLSQDPDYPIARSPPPPRPPRNQNRPQSPEIPTRPFEQPQTPPRTPPQPTSALQPTTVPPLQIQPTSSGRSVSVLRLPFSRSHTYPAPSTPTSASSASSSYSLHSPQLHSSQATHLTYVREEEERVGLELESASHRYDDDTLHDDALHADIEDEGEPDLNTRSHTGDHSFIHEQHLISREADGRSDVASRGGIHEDSDRGSFVGSEAAHGDDRGRSIWSPYTSFLPSLVTAPGGNGQPPSITSTVKTKWIESAALTKRAKNHLNRIKKWRKRATTVVVDGRYSKRGKEGAQVGNLERSVVIEMIGDGVEMARSCYSPRIHKLGYELGKEVQQWLQTFTDNDPAVLYKKENISLLTTIQTCFLPILLMRLAELEPPAATLANDLIVSLTKVPLSLHENEIQTQTDSGAPLFTSPPAKSSHGRPSSSGSRSVPSSTSIPLVPHHRTTSISSIAIHLVAQELGSASPACPNQHSWLGMSLLKIVEMTMKIRHISFGEMEDIRAVARKREKDYPLDGTSFPPLIDARFTRPWEVALFALCATAEAPGATTFFRRMVLGPMGIPVFMQSLDSLLSMKIDMDDVKWEDVGLTLRAFAFVSEHAWVVQGMSGNSDGKGDKVEGIIKAIMGVFWRDIPERWFSIRFWAMDAVRNIVSHRPPLVRLLADIKADQAFVTLTPTSSLYPSVINTSRMINEAGEKVRNKMLEEYRKESAKRAQEMVDYIRMFHGVGEGKMNAGKHVVLQPVAIGFDGR